MNNLATANAVPACRWCGQIHGPQCPRVKALEFGDDGCTVKRVEFFAPVDYPPIGVSDPARHRHDDWHRPKSSTEHLTRMGTMAEWQPMETAPRDGTEIQAEIPGHGADNVIAFLEGYVDYDGRHCGAWTFTRDQEPPDSWTDGACWEVNEDGEPSVQPARWKPLPSQQIEE